MVSTEQSYSGNRELIEYVEELKHSILVGNRCKRFIIAKPHPARDWSDAHDTFL
jgi:hypothetical protein